MKDNNRDNAAENRVRVSFYSLPRNVALARILTAAMLTESDLLLADLEEIKVAVSEAVSNAIIHGYRGETDQTVEMEIHTSPGRLTIEISDRGVGIADIKQAMQPNYSQIEERMGLGFCFMQSFMDEVSVVSAPGEGTCVKLTKYLPSVTDEKQNPQVSSLN